MAGSHVDGWNTKIDPFLMMPFIYHDGGNRLFVRDGRIIAAFAQPEWRDGLVSSSVRIVAVSRAVGPVQTE